MKEKTAAAKIFLLRSIDENVRILRVLDIVDNLDIEKVIDYYKDITADRYEVAEVITSFELDESAKKAIESNLIKKFADKELIFVYEQDRDVPGGIKITVGDNKINFSFDTNL